MRLTVVGSAGSVAGPDNPASCYLLEAEAAGRTWRLVLDLGPGALGPLQRYCDPTRVDAVLISHGHVDHCADLASLSVLRRYGPAAEAGLPRLPLLGPQGLDKRILELAGDTGPEPDYGDLAPFDFTSLAQGGRVSLGPFDVAAARAWHPVPALAYRVEGPGEAGGRVSLVFTGDTDLSDEVRDLARGADVLLAEAGWAHREVNPPGIHMNGTQAGQLAADAGAGRLLVTHVASWVAPGATLDQARALRPEADLAAPGLTYSI